MKYYVLRCSEDGDVSVSSMTKEELEASLADGEFDISEMNPMENETIYDFASGSHPLIIIKGEEVVPKAAKEVTRWKV